jgi:Transglycosylase-like domain
VFDRWRYPAALAVAVGVAFPALAIAAGSHGVADHARKAGPLATQGHGPRALTRPARRLQRTIDEQVPRIRAQQRREPRQAHIQLPGGVSQSTLDAIAACESGGDPTAVSSDGTYRGKYQFDYGTWASVGGHGDPAAAPESEQDYRAALLYEQSSSSPWPICG